MGTFVAAGIDLTAGRVGFGVPAGRDRGDRRDRDRAVGARGIRLHGFGVKPDGPARIGHMLASAGSMA